MHGGEVLIHFGNSYKSTNVSGGIENEHCAKMGTIFSYLPIKGKVANI